MENFTLENSQCWKDYLNADNHTTKMLSRLFTQYLKILTYTTTESLGLQMENMSAEHINTKSDYSAESPALQ